MMGRTQVAGITVRKAGPVDGHGIRRDWMGMAMAMVRLGSGWGRDQPRRTRCRAPVWILCDARLVEGSWGKQTEIVG